MLYLRQSTASQEVCLGPFVDATDGKTAETGLTIANTDIVIWKHGATATGTKNSGGGTHMAGGLYSAVLDATDSNTLGNMVVLVNVSGALPVRHEFVVLPSNIYDSMILGTDLFDVSVTQFGGSNGSFTAGIPAVNMTQISGASVSASTAQLGVNVVNFGGSAGTFVSGIPAVNVSQFGGSAGTFSAGRPEVNMTHIAGSAVSTSTAQLGVNVVNFGGSAGSFASGIPAVNATQLSGDSTAADNAEAFFDGTGYAGTNNVIPTVTAVTNAVSANVTQISGDSVAADNAEAFFDGTGYAGTNNVIPTVTDVTNNVNTTVGSFGTNSITAAALAADAVAEIAAGVGALAGADPLAPPDATAGLAAKIDWLCAYFLNAKTCNRSTGATTVYANDGTSDGGAAIGQMTVSDNGVTASFTLWE